MVVGDGSLVDKFAHAIGWPRYPERSQDGACGLLGIVGGCVGNALPQAPRFDRTDFGAIGSRTSRGGMPGAVVRGNQVLDHAGFLGRPTWAELKDGLRPPQPVSSEPGEWQHGWQYHASSSLETTSWRP